MGCRSTSGVHRAGRSRGDLLRPRRRHRSQQRLRLEQCLEPDQHINQSVLQPGDTVYIAAGTYGPLNTLRSGAAGQPLVFKRATDAEHGTATGWTSSMDGQVVIDGGRSLAAIGIGEGGAYTGQSFVTIDGATR